VGRENPFYPFDSELSVNISSSVVTLPATQLSKDKAILNGSLPLSMSASSRYFEWGETEDLGQITTNATQSLVGTFTKELVGLSPNTIYYYRAVIKTTTETINGEIMSFQTTN